MLRGSKETFSEAEKGNIEMIYSTELERAKSLQAFPEKRVRLAASRSDQRCRRKA